MENVGGKLHDIDLGNDVLAMTTKALATKGNMDRWDYIKPKSFCIAKEIINRVKRTGENTCGPYI